VRLEGVTSNQMQRIDRWELHAMPIFLGQARLRIAGDGVAAAVPLPTRDAHDSCVLNINSAHVFGPNANSFRPCVRHGVA
jgi:hypothetical protein